MQDQIDGLRAKLAYEIVTMKGNKGDVLEFAYDMIIDWWPEHEHESRTLERPTSGSADLLSILMVLLVAQMKDYGFILHRSKNP